MRPLIGGFAPYSLTLLFWGSTSSLPYHFIVRFNAVFVFVIIFVCLNSVDQSVRVHDLAKSENVVIDGEREGRGTLWNIDSRDFVRTKRDLVFEKRRMQFRQSVEVGCTFVHFVVSFVVLQGESTAKFESPCERIRRGAHPFSGRMVGVRFFVWVHWPYDRIPAEM